MSNITQAQIQQIYKDKNAVTGEQKVKVINFLRQRGHTIMGQAGIIKQAPEESNFGAIGRVAGEAAKNVGGYALGAIPRLFTGTAGEAAKGLGDIAKGISAPFRGKPEEMGAIGQGFGRLITSPVSGLTNAVTRKTVQQLAGDTGQQLGEGVQRGVSGVGQMGTGLVQGIGALAQGKTGRELEEAATNLNMGRTQRYRRDNEQ